MVALTAARPMRPRYTKPGTLTKIGASLKDSLDRTGLMLMALKASLRNSIIDAIVNQTNFTAYTAVWITLHTGDPGDTGANEASGSGYARVDATNKFPAASSGSSANDVAISFAAFSGAFAFTHSGMRDASSAGTWIGGGALTTPKSVASGDSASFAVGAYVLSLS
jgi:hypothetical protein